jgi:hypothetical protein
LSQHLTQISLWPHSVHNRKYSLSRCCTSWKTKNKLYSITNFLKSRHFSLISEKNLYPSLRCRNVFFIPCIQLSHNYRFGEGSLIKNMKFLLFLCVWWVPRSGCPVFIFIQVSSLVAPTWNFLMFPKRHYQLLTYSKLVS